MTGTTDPADSTRTLLWQLESVASQITAGFVSSIGNHAGSAFVTGGGYADCCALQLHVNTCDETFAIPGLTPCVDQNPFVTFTRDSACVDCDDDPVTQTYTCGIRAITKPLRPNCDCEIKMPLAYYGVKLDIEPMDSESGTWKEGHWDVCKTYSGSLPANFGSWIQYQEYIQPAGWKCKKL